MSNPYLHGVYVYIGRDAGARTPAMKTNTITIIPPDPSQFDAGQYDFTYGSPTPESFLLKAYDLILQGVI